MKAFNSEQGKEAVMNYYGMMLEKLTVPHEKIEVGTRFGKTFVICAGEKSAPPMFLLHGSSMNSSMWVGDIPKYSGAYRVYAPDMPGEPGKSDENQLPFDSSDYSDWLSDVMSALGVKKTVLIGASLGAWLAVKFSVEHPESVEKLVLLCPGGIGSQNHKFKEIALSLLTKGEEGVNELFRMINGGAEIPEAVLNYQKLIAVSFNSRKEELPVFSDGDLKKLNMPVAVFVGGKDIMLRSDETIDRITRLLPDATAVMLPERGHSLSGLCDDILGFLNR